jgi:hypothetical protein
MYPQIVSKRFSQKSFPIPNLAATAVFKWQSALHSTIAFLTTRLQRYTPSGGKSVPIMKSMTAYTWYRLTFGFAGLLVFAGMLLAVGDVHERE